MLSRNVLLHETPDNCTELSLVNLYSVSEIDRFQNQIISSEDILDQIVGCLVTPSFTHTVRIGVLCCLENVSYNYKSHYYLVKPHVINAIMGASSMRITPTVMEGMDQAECLKNNSNLIK